MLLYKIWGEIRRSAAKIGVNAEEIVFSLTKGRKPTQLFTAFAKPEKIETNVKIVFEEKDSTTIAKYNPDGTISDDDFVILTTTDFHLDEYELSRKTMEMFVRQIKDNKPDLIVLTGDIVLGKYQQVDAIKFARLMEKMGIYWTAVFGNHEVREEKGFYKWLLLDSFRSYKHCLCKHGPDELYGYGNYTVNILDSKGLKQTLFMFDSGRDMRDRLRKEYNIPDGMNGYDFLKKEQIDFYKNETDRLIAKYGKAPSMMYMHIALKEFEEVFEKDENDRYVPTGKAELLWGEQYESVGSSPYNSGMFDAILEKGCTQAVFAGHDHINDWCAKYKGIYLVYSLHAGYTPYHLGTNFNKPESEWMQGVTITTIKNDGSIEIRPDYNRKYINYISAQGE